MTDEYRHLHLTAVSAATGVSGDAGLRTTYGEALWVLLLMTGVVLLITCLNLMNLMLARASAREQEVAVRVALGASRRRVVGQLTIESLLLAVTGAILGALLSQPLSRGLIALLATDNNVPSLSAPFDWRVFAFSAGVALATSLAFGLVPALRASAIHPGAAMRGGGRGLGTSGGGLRVQRYLVAGQVTLSVVLVVGAILFVRTFVNLATVDTGLRRDGVLLASFADASTISSGSERALVEADLLQRIRAIPQVDTAAATARFPLNGGHWTLGVTFPWSDASTRQVSQFTYVGPQYFQTVGMRIVTGRDFTDHDTQGAPPVALVNETFVRQYLPAGGPLGRTLRSVAEPGLPETLYTIVGVVSDTKNATLREPVPPIAFVPLAQDPVASAWPGIVIHSAAPPSVVMASVRRVVADVRPNMVIRFTELDAQIRDSLMRERLLAWLSGALGSLALLLALIGIYGVIAYVVARRRHDIGIRLALGAGRAGVIRWVLGQIASMLAIGLTIGVVCSMVVTRAANDFLFGLSPRDPLTIVSAAGLLAVIALLAVAVPAIRASRLEPTAALGCE